MSRWALELGLVFESGYCLDLTGVLRGDAWNQWSESLGVGHRNGGEVLTYFDISLHLTGCLAVVFLIQRRSELV